MVTGSEESKGECWEEKGEELGYIDTTVREMTAACVDRLKLALICLEQGPTAVKLWQEGLYNPSQGSGDLPKG